MCANMSAYTQWAWDLIYLLHTITVQLSLEEYVTLPTVNIMGPVWQYGPNMDIRVDRKNIIIFFFKRYSA